jgi:hypothetical protein
VHALLHGDGQQAVAYNLLTVLAIPFLLVWAGRCEWAAVLGRPFHRRPLPSWFVRTVLVAVVAFWVLRNIPFYPLTLLAPHAL